jgi:hypothetical protein
VLLAQLDLLDLRDRQGLLAPPERRALREALARLDRLASREQQVLLALQELLALLVRPAL